MNEVYMGVLF